MGEKWCGDAHGVQGADPLAVLYLPAGHSVHVAPPSLPVYPGLQRHASMSLLPSDASVLLGQEEQGPAPVKFLNVIPGQARQRSPSARAVCPLRQVQAVIRGDATGEVLPAGHFSHTPPGDLNVPAAHGTHGPPLGPTNPSTHVHARMLVLWTLDIECAGQAVQLPLPEEFLKVSFWQAVHVPPSGPVKPALQRQCVCAVLPVDE